MDLTGNPSRLEVVRNRHIWFSVVMMMMLTMVTMMAKMTKLTMTIGRPVLQTSNCHFLSPSTPQRTLPEFIPDNDHHHDNYHLFLMTIIISIMMMMISLLVDDERRKLLNFFEKRQTQFRFYQLGQLVEPKKPLKKG